MKYWFESASDIPLEILHITGKVPGAKEVRMNYTPMLEQQEQTGINVYEYQEKHQS